MDFLYAIVFMIVVMAAIGLCIIAIIFIVKEFDIGASPSHKNKPIQPAVRPYVQPKVQKPQQPNVVYQSGQMPYVKKYLLTNNEYYFYKKLKPLANKYDLQILTKIRLADLIEVKKGMPSRTWGYYFGKIKAKHIDFVIVDDMKVVLLIELDDNSHKTPDRIERDRFVNEAVGTAGYLILHSYGDTKNIENVLMSYRNKNNHVNYQ